MFHELLLPNDFSSFASDVNNKNASMQSTKIDHISELISEDVPTCPQYMEVPKLIANSWIEILPTRSVSSYKQEQVAGLRTWDSSLMLNVDKNEKKSGTLDANLSTHINERRACWGYAHIYASQKWSDDTCVAVVYARGLPYTPPLLRFKGEANAAYHPLRKNYLATNAGKELKRKDQLRNTDAFGRRIFKYAHSSTSDGFVNKVPLAKDREPLRSKMKRLLENLPQVEKYISIRLQALLDRKKRNGGQDVVLMTVNPGEMDMLVNFACSCRHHGIDTSNVVVFAASETIVDSINALGFIAIYDQEFERVAADASAQYLDPIFIDMMWYKSFSVWVLIKMGFNVLFQDVDLVWFKDPFPYFAENRMVGSTMTDAYFSDDGQRGLRYAPFYANSGFYYLRANKRSEYFAWLTLAAFDSIKVDGSHQNVFVAKLTEALDIAGLAPFLLNLDDFPTGVKYHRDKPYMKAIEDGWRKPYNFHMCWTLNKKNKIEYFRQVNMWYINGTSRNSDGDGGGNRDAGDACALAAAYRAPAGSLYQIIAAIKDSSQRRTILLQKCCKNPLH